MNKFIVPLVIVAALSGVAYYTGLIGGTDSPAGAAAAGGPPGGPRGGFPPGGPPGAGGGGRGGRGGPVGPLTVELAPVSRAEMAEQLTVVGNLVGDATVAVVPRVAGRLQDITVRLGDRVRMGQRIAKIEDQELQEQVRQAEAAFEVSKATIRQREADMSLAKTNVERARSLTERDLLPQQTLDDNESRFQAAIAQLDLAQAQNTQSQARLDELRITLTNTVILSPVDGFVARRAADPGAFVSQNAPIVDVVDIGLVRLVVNVVEKDLRQVNAGDTALVEVDAYPGEQFRGRIARVAPVLDPATRTAPIEIEIQNSDFRLKPGMYARVRITTASRRDALVVPSIAVIDLNGRRGVFLASDSNVAVFREVQTGIETQQLVEILNGVTEADRVVTTGAAGLSNGASFIVSGQDGRRGGESAGNTPTPRGGGDDGAPAGRQGRGGRRGGGAAGDGRAAGPGTE